MTSQTERDERRTGEQTAASTSRSRRELLRAGAGVAAAAAAIPAFGGQAVAHFPDELAIDVKPYSDESPIVTKGFGYVPVAVLQTDEFDPTDEAVRYRFGALDVVGDGGGGRPLHDGYVTDLDGDGRDDLLLLFATRHAGFDGDETQARIEWERTESGEHGLAGTDAVTLVGHDGSKGWKHGGH